MAISFLDPVHGSIHCARLGIFGTLLVGRPLWTGKRAAGLFSEPFGVGFD